ncbi:MAG: hypothetical protein QOI21_5256 [Actinomycetota bacterium]|jgi:uncharacterized protein YhfF|nr:hypothetical protein [Actinomycetota bacterium]
METVEFAFPGPLRDALVASILRGDKTSTSALAVHYDGEELPRVGERLSVVDSAERGVAVIEVTEVRLLPLSEVDVEHAIAEGEDYSTVAGWRAEHEKFWHSPEVREELGDPEFTVTDDSIVVAWRFRLVESTT